MRHARATYVHYCAHESVEDALAQGSLTFLKLQATCVPINVKGY